MAAANKRGWVFGLDFVGVTADGSGGEAVGHWIENEAWLWLRYGGAESVIV